MTAKPRTFDLDGTLPNLPVPRLEDSVQRYLDSVEPLVDASTFSDIKAAAEELLQPDGTGRKLQTALEARAARSENWLAGWWEDVAYLSYPESLVINSSIGISTDARYAPGDQAMRAGQLTGGTLDFYLSILNETMPPEVQRDGSGMDMSLLKRFFATNRYPGTEGDRIATFGGGQSRHIIVIRKHRFFELEVINASGERLSDGDLMAQFRRILATDTAARAPAVGVLTAARRPDWARARDRLAASPANRHVLDRIDRALFLVCLDDELAPNFEDLARSGLHGQKGNRWHDKSFHLVIDPQGRFTLHGEHTPVDAGAWVPLIEAIGGPADPLPAQKDTSAPAPLELHWELPLEATTDIADASVVFDNLIRDLDLRIVHFDAFGKDLIKTFKTGPDPFLQMSFMLAYKRMYGRLPKTYEAASTRIYKGGRTETIRTASNEALAFVTAMDDVVVAADHKVEMLRAAFAKHSERGREASAGFACDRHLLGLKLIAKEAGVSELPRFFSQEIFTRGWELSTAQLAMRVGFVNHFGPVCPGGYGIGYIIKNDHVNINVTSFRSHPQTDSSRFLGEITRAMHDLRAVLELVQDVAA
jgi:carnitine O-acetyltransferase